MKKLIALTVLGCAALHLNAQEIKVAMPAAPAAPQLEALAKACSAAVAKNMRECLSRVPPFTGYNHRLRAEIADSCESQRRGDADMCAASLAKAEQAQKDGQTQAPSGAHDPDKESKQ